MKKRKIAPIGAGSMADVAFLLLVFFLVATTIETDAGLSVVLPAWSEEAQDKTPWEDRNVLSIQINSNDALLVEDEAAQVSDLKERTKQLILKEAESPQKAIVYIKSDHGTSYDQYIAVYNEIKAGYNQIWDDASMRKFGQHYEDLNKRAQKTIREVYPLVISEAEPTDFAVK